MSHTHARLPTRPAIWIDIACSVASLAASHGIECAIGLQIILIGTATVH
jgi:hypothetical protein